MIKRKEGAVEEQSSAEILLEYKLAFQAIDPNSPLIDSSKFFSDYFFQKAQIIDWSF